MNFEQYIVTFLALEELKEMGYKEVWVGCECPHWDWKGSGSVVAAPKIRPMGRPAMWACSEKHFGKMSCGNGLKNADQMQRNGAKIIPGHYKLINNSWESDIFNK